ncbi:MAG: ATP-dependent RNA helicase HrpA [Gammaproteobacteria bacterium]
MMLEKLEADLSQCSISERSRLARRLSGLRHRQRQGKPIERGLQELELKLTAASQRVQQRQERLPRPRFEDNLPINQRREEIARAIAQNQVVIVCGETGSGKTTQLPKICLDIGLGVRGLIGHTQPRRIAARAVAARLRTELDDPNGQQVGYKVRFSDHSHPEAFIKLMTDGILLAETQGDRLLEQYEVIIVDEAHERSLNIDFLLGYLQRILPQRPDLKVIITSATIDPERFARHFSAAPIIEVSGRTFPVEVRYRPLLSEDEDQRDLDMQEAIIAAVDELCMEGSGDILVFLSGEREIRECAESLRKHKLRDTEVVPLYARLSAAEQNRVFQSHKGRRIVLSTNVAETSLTVPGIRYVIDTGLARISRYSHRSKVQRLPIEKISRASEAQRAGRCGRVSAGVCIRLYDEDDFLARPEFTDPEILRTNLAAVILQMCALRLGEVADFPFIDPPDRRLINDGFKLLFELGAVDEQHRISALGKQLARLPIDPRLGRMILAARDEGAMSEVLVIASALAIQDPRERPLEKQQAADEKHRRFRDQESDFVAFLNLWNYYHEQARHLSNSKLRKLCKDEFLSYVRMREWHDLHKQLHALVTEMGLAAGQNSQPAEYPAVHRALLSGLLGHIGMRLEDQSWLGARHRKFFIFPGSGLFKRGPKWLMAAELVETSKLYARTVARIDPGWVESLAGHLLKRSYAEPHWEKKPAQVGAKERVTLYGLPIVASRRVNFGPIDPELSRELFIQHALVEADFYCKAPFFKHNQALLAELAELEEKTRRRDLLVTEQAVFDFYDQRIPAGIYSGASFERWRRKAERQQPQLLYLQRSDLLAQEPLPDAAEQFPEQLRLDGLELPLSYRFDPAADDDGVTVTIPLPVLNQVDPRWLEWLVPGLLSARMTALIKSLPKALRKNFVPAPDFVQALREVLQPGPQPLTRAMGERLQQMSGVVIPEDAWQPDMLPKHLQMRVRILDAQGHEIAQGRDLAALQEGLRGKAEQSFATLSDHDFERERVNEWNFGALPEVVEFSRNGVAFKGYPALVKEDNGLALRLLDDPARAEQALRTGLRELARLKLKDKIKTLRRKLPQLQRMSLHYIGIGSQSELETDLFDAIIERACFRDPSTGSTWLPRAPDDFERCLSQGRSRLPVVAKELGDWASDVLAQHHTLRTQLAGELPLSWTDAVQDIRAQLDRLIYPGFISATPEPWRAYLARYLKAIELRLDKLRYAPDKDRQRLGVLAPLWDAYTNAEAALTRQHKPLSAELTQFRWLLEELRVSLFAQELKTAQPISAKRLDALWREIARTL